MNKITPIVVGFLLTVSAVRAIAHEEESPAAATAPKMFAAAGMQWQEAPPSLPAGAQMVVLDGDPRKGGLFTIRLKMPAGYRIPPHTHPTAERITVISGTVNLGIGEKFIEAGGRELHAGDFAVVPPRVPHFAWCAGEAVLQIHGEGPFQRNFVDSADQSAKAKK